jgi:hypothetical protein
MPWRIRVALGAHVGIWIEAFTLPLVLECVSSCVS